MTKNRRLFLSTESYYKSISNKYLYDLIINFILINYFEKKVLVS